MGTPFQISVPAENQMEGQNWNATLYDRGNKVSLSIG